MQQSKLLEVLRRFSGRQLSRFRDFLESPYFNRAPELVRFYAFLAAYAPDFQDPALDKSAVLQQFAREKPLTPKRLAYLMNQLQQLAEEFLGVEHFRADDFEAAMALLRVWHPNDLPRHYRYTLEKAIQAIQNTTCRNAEYYLNTFRLKAIQYDHSDPNQHQMLDSLQQASHALDEFYLVEQLRYGWEMANLEYMLNLKYDWKIGHRLLDFLAQEPLAINRTAQIYLSGIRMIKEPDNTAHFFYLKNALQEHESRFSEPELKHLYNGLLNYCTRRINQQNDQQFSNEYLSINKNLLAKGLLFEDGQLSPWHFLNLVNTGLRSNQTDWVQTFIKDYHRYLPDDYAEDIRLTAQGQYHYQLQEYGQAQVLLNQANPRDVLLAVTVRNLLTRIYYETGETELLLFFLEAYRVYLIRQTLLSAQMKKQARQFVDFTRKLAKIDRPEAHQLVKLKAELPPAREIYHRDWLLQQIDLKMQAFGQK